MSLKTEVEEIRVERRGDVAVLHLLGDHDTCNVEQLRQAIAAPVEAGDGVVVSLMETQFIDSAVVHALCRADQGLRQQGRRLALQVATATLVRRVLEVSGLSSDLPSTGSLEAALAFAARDETG